PAASVRDFLSGAYRLHCCRPEFPMYDQHVHRAMTFIEEGQRDELGKKPDHRKIEIYLTRYLSFYKEQFVRIEPRRVDKALWAFGKFLKTSGLPEPAGTAQA
ncbi:MAG: hypothetical protein WCE23_06155, partial [Candidatus Binatus sp.]|uniref:hypothetical protein n=1 Tax=Candidatus Binatus sp. TaxID=2811406 RepID=UPI003C7539E0